MFFNFKAHREVFDSSHCLRHVEIWPVVVGFFFKRWDWVCGSLSHHRSKTLLSKLEDAAFKIVLSVADLLALLPSVSVELVDCVRVNANVHFRLYYFGFVLKIHFKIEVGVVDLELAFLGA